MQEKKTNIKAHPLYANLNTQIISLHLVESSLQGKRSFQKVWGGGRIYFQSYKTSQQHWVQLRTSIPEVDCGLCKHIQLLNQPNSLRFLLIGRRATGWSILTAATKSMKLVLTHALRDFSVFTVTGKPKTA